MGAVGRCWDGGSGGNDESKAAVGGDLADRHGARTPCVARLLATAVPLRDGARDHVVEPLLRGAPAHATFVAQLRSAAGGFSCGCVWCRRGDHAGRIARIILQHDRPARRCRRAADGEWARLARCGRVWQPAAGAERLEAAQHAHIRLPDGKAAGGLLCRVKQW